MTVGLPPQAVTPTASAASVGLYDLDADELARIVAEDCPSVAGLSAGWGGSAATYLPGRSVAGIQFAPGIVTVHVVARLGFTVKDIARDVRSALAGRVAGQRIDIVVEDVDLEGAPRQAVDAVSPA